MKVTVRKTAWQKVLFGSVCLKGDILDYHKVLCNMLLFK